MTAKRRTIKDLKWELHNMGVKIPTKGSGSKGGVIRGDLVKLLAEEKKKGSDKKLKKRLSEYKVKDLIQEMEHLDIKKPKRGSGKNGKVTKEDLLRIIDQKKESNKKSTLPEGIFFTKMPPDLLRGMLMDTSITNVVKVCNLNKYTRNRVCNEGFWEAYVKSKKYVHNNRTSYKTWREFAIKEHPYGEFDIYDMGKEVRYKLTTKEVAEAKIVTHYESLTYKGELNYVENLRDDKNDEILDNLESYPDSYPNSYGSDDDDDVEDDGYDPYSEPEEIEIDGYQFYYDYVTDTVDGYSTSDSILIYDSEWDGNKIYKNL